MENTLVNYLDKDLKGCVSSLKVCQGTVKDSGQIYYYVELGFINGYKKRIFLKEEERFAWTNAFDLLTPQKVIDNNF